MASIGQVIFWGLIVLIFIVAGLLILILSISLTSSQAFVESQDPFPVGNLGGDALLACSFRVSPSEPGGSASVTWEKAGLSGEVFRYASRVPQLPDQSPQFRGRAHFLPSGLAAGNASLELWSVGPRDAGEYRCSVSAPGGRGSASVRLSVAAYSSPVFTLKGRSLSAEADRWFPEPSVNWSDREGRALNASELLSNASAGIFRVETALLEPAQRGHTYTCLISNHLVTAVSLATVTEDGVKSRTRFIFNSAPTLRPLLLAVTMPLHLWTYYLLT